MNSKLFLSLFLPGYMVTSPAVFAKSKINISDKEKPNILFIVSEDNGMELSCYGAPVKTPNLDILASSGTRFINSYVTQAGSSPSRASFFTGLYPHQNGQVGLATWKYSMYQQNTPNIVTELKKAGYKVGNIGKIHVNPESAFPFDYHKIKGSNFNRKNMEDYINYSYEFITSSDSPFYLQVNFPDAHDPFIPQIGGRPKNILKKDDVQVLPYMGVTTDSLKEMTANYYNCMMRLDELVGDLIAALKKSGKYENTIIVYIGDHGADILRGKRTCYEGGTRIPLLISWPEQFVINKTYDGFVSTIDLFPTFLSVAGEPIPNYLPGKSLIPILKGDKKPLREYLFTEYNVHSNHNPYPQRTIRNQKYKLIWNLVSGNENPGFNYTLTDIIKSKTFYEGLFNAPKYVIDSYIQMKNPPEYELYDLENDKFEWHNLAYDKKYASVLNQLKRELNKWQKETRDPFIDKTVALRFFKEIMNSHLEKIEIKYHSYMNPNYNFKTNDE